MIAESDIITTLNSLTSIENYEIDHRCLDYFIEVMKAEMYSLDLRGKT